MLMIEQNGWRLTYTILKWGKAGFQHMSGSFLSEIVVTFSDGDNRAMLLGNFDSNLSMQQKSKIYFSVNIFSQILSTSIKNNHFKSSVHRLHGTGQTET